jgi:hypothetical protein
MKICGFLFLALLAEGVAFAQLISVGLKGGIPLTDAAPYKDESRPYTVGASIEVRLPGHFAVEGSALYQRIGNSNRTLLLFAPVNMTSSYRQRGNSWEFPILGKYYFRPMQRGWEPFVGTGYALRTVQFQTDGQATTLDEAGKVTTIPFHTENGNGLGVGATFAAGVRMPVGRFAVMPEVRYTRWGGTDNNRTKRNNVKLLVGITF